MDAEIQRKTVAKKYGECIRRVFALIVWFCSQFLDSSVIFGQKSKLFSLSLEFGPLQTVEKKYLNLLQNSDTNFRLRRRNEVL